MTFIKLPITGISSAQFRFKLMSNQSNMLKEQGVSIQYRTTLPKAFANIRKKHRSKLFADSIQSLAIYLAERNIFIAVEKTKPIHVKLEFLKPEELGKTKPKQKMIITAYFDKWFPRDIQAVNKKPRWDSPNKFLLYVHGLIRDWSIQWKKEVLVDKEINCYFYNPPVKKEPYTGVDFSFEIDAKG